MVSHANLALPPRTCALDIFTSMFSMVLSHLQDTAVKDRKALPRAVQNLILLLHALSSLID